MNIVSVLEGENILKKAKEAKKIGANILELRVDLLKYRNFGTIKNILKKVKFFTKLPIILTVRRKQEGGKASDNSSRIEIFKRLITLVDIVDIEIYSKIFPEVIKLSQVYKKKVIISYHNLGTTPSLAELSKIVKKARQYKPWVVKMVTRVREWNDIERLEKVFLEHKGKDLAVFGHGELGFLSRFIFFLLGSVLMYGYVGRFSVISGQFSLKEIVILKNFLARRFLVGR